MRLVSYLQEGRQTLGLEYEGVVINLPATARLLGSSVAERMEDFLQDATQDAHARAVDARFRKGDFRELAQPMEALQLLAPLPRPTSCRDGYAFRQHVAAARRNRGVPMIPEFDHYPIFYFTNHNAILGPGVVPCMADHFRKLDFELEAAIVVGRRGRNLRAEQADDYIYGLTIMNDVSARTLQMEEMLLNLGPAKGKDFATTIGPVLVTVDELEAQVVAPKAGHVGKAWNLNMAAYHNGTLVSSGNVADMDWTFAEILERCAYGVDIWPGDVIGSGTVGTGCYLELNGTARLENPDAVDRWIQPGDRMDLTIDHLGTLSNTFVLEDSFSILERKKG
jgi:fumarylacetoacetate (FAA) hydrolase